MSSQLPSKTLLLLAALMLAGCAKPAAEVVQDTKRDSERGLLRKRYFDECMKLLPAGPQSTQYNDWAEVVAECNSAAWYQANQVMP